jgi:branched-subunit amino acid transport protein
MNDIDTIMVWCIIFGGTVATYATRLSFFVLIRYERLPKLFQRGLHYVPPTILAALIFPDLIRPACVFNISFDNHRLIAGLLAAIVSWRTKSIWLTIAVGMVVLWLLSNI